MANLDGKIALVTGGASGIGEATTEEFACLGASVIMTDVQVERGEEVANRTGAVFIEHDVSIEDAWRKVASEIEARYGRLDILVNNAGILSRGSIEESDFESWNSMMTINAGSVFLGCKYGIDLMKANGGSIINLSSAAALRPKSFVCAYAASKAAVASLTRTTALHCAEQGYNIRCNSIHPGVVDTPMATAGLFDDEAGRVLLDRHKALHPLGRIATVADVTAAVVYLTSDAAAFITGVALPVDGGYAID